MPQGSVYSPRARPTAPARPITCPTATTHPTLSPGAPQSQSHSCPHQPPPTPPHPPQFPFWEGAGPFPIPPPLPPVGPTHRASPPIAPLRRAARLHVVIGSFFSANRGRGGVAIAAGRGEGGVASRGRGAGGVSSCSAVRAKEGGGGTALGPPRGHPSGNGGSWAGGEGSRGGPQCH